MGWGSTHRSWPGGQGGKLRALVAGEGWGRRRGWMAVPKKGRCRAPGRGGPGAVVPGGVGGRGTGPRDGANFATCVVGEGWGWA